MTEPFADQWYWEVVATCPSDQEELFSYYLFEANVSGIEEIARSENTIDLKIYFQSQQIDPKSCISSIKAKLGVDCKRIVTRSIEKKRFENWQSNWKEHFKAISIGNSFVVRPPWEKAVPDKKEIVIHPGFGFGTGYHESTNLALRLLELLGESHCFESVIDVGAGSGILTIAALLLNAKQVTAIDIELETLEEIQNNLLLSGLDKQKCDVRICEPDKLKGNAELVVANIEDHILIKMAKELSRLTKPSGHLLLSGILTEKKVELIHAFSNEFNLIKELEMEEWTGMILKKNLNGKNQPHD